MMEKSLFLDGKVIFMITENFHKYHEARRILLKNDIATAMFKTKITEIQDDNLENISRIKALNFCRRSNLPIIVEDAGLFIRKLKGFPGPYSSYVYRTLGLHGILELMKNIRDRRAVFRSVVTFCNGEGVLKIFEGTIEGKITNSTRGNQGFGFDPIFEAFETPNSTFAELSIDQKSIISHRSKSLREFAKFYKAYFSKAFK